MTALGRDLARWLVLGIVARFGLSGLGACTWVGCPQEGPEAFSTPYLAEYVVSESPHAELVGTSVSVESTTDRSPYWQLFVVFHTAEGDVRYEWPASFAGIDTGWATP